MSVGADSHCSVFQSVDDTTLASQIVMAVPLYVCDPVCGLSAHCCNEGVIRLRQHQSISKKGMDQSVFVSSVVN